MFANIQMNKYFGINVIAVLVVLASNADGVDVRLKDGVLFSEFYNFALRQGRPYLYNNTELLSRFQVYKDSIKQAETLNRPYKEINNLGAVFGVNKFADLTTGEFKAKYLSGLSGSTSSLKFRSTFSSVREFQPKVNISALPRSVDWRKKSVLSPVIDQKDCGACWAFSLVETMEAMSVIENKTKSVGRLSSQEFIDCDEGNHGCSGGDICQAAEWAHTNGIVLEKYYPLTRKTETCKHISESAQKVTVTDFICADLVNNEDKILETVANHGPVTVAVDASTWHNYVKGIIRFHCSDHVNHAVQIVGYNLDGDVPYYIVRNSWGSDFGEKGYLYLRYGKNLCGVATRVVKLTVSSWM